MEAFSILPSSISGLSVIERRQLKDDRGYFERMFCQDSLNVILAGRCVRQINRSVTSDIGVVRGLHFQYPPHSEIKIITCVKGAVWDVAVDLRRGSPTFLQHHAFALSEEARQSVLIPEGFAHGFQALSPDCELIYIHTADYHSESEAGLNALDPRLGIDWPKPVTLRSEKDVGHPLMSDDFQGVVCQ